MSRKTTSSKKWNADNIELKDALCNPKFEWTQFKKFIIRCTTQAKKQRINTRKITLFLPLISQMIIDNQSQQPWHCPLLFLKNIFNQPARLLHNNSKFWMSEYSFVFFFLNNCWFFTRYSLLFLRSKELIHTIIFRMLTLLMWNRTHRAHAAGRINIFSTLTMK